MGWIVVNLYNLVSNSQIGDTGLDICGLRYSPGRLKVNESVTCTTSFSVDLGQFFASSGGLVLKDFSLCGVFIGAGTRIGTGVTLGCTSPEDRAIQQKAAAEAADKAAAEKLAADKAAAEKLAADKAAAEKLAADKAAAEKLAADKAAAAKKAADALAAAKIKAAQAAAIKKTTITCIKGKLVKKVTAVKPTCPKGYKKK
jgi:hypothetical protein